MEMPLKWFVENDDKIKRRESLKNLPKPIYPYVIISVIAAAILLVTVIYLCVAILSQDPSHFYETSYISDLLLTK